MGGRYDTLIVPTDLTPMVDSVWHQHSDPDLAAPPTRILPALYGNLIINRGDRYEHAPPRPLTVPHVSLHGIRTRAIGAVATGRTDLIIFNLRPWAVAALAAMPAAELTDQVLDLDPDRVSDGAAWVEGPVAAAVDRIFDRLRALTAGRGDLRLLASVTDRLACLPVAAAAAELGMTRRHLQRIMNARMGVSPKRFQQLRRYQAALPALRRGEHGAQVAAALGYVDQAHLN
ncbi:MAG: helix-turn-helix domain-containing protein, partial [Pseudomonadota bacterium]